MKTTPMTPSDLAASVLAVPPLPLGPDLAPSEWEMRRLAGVAETGPIFPLLSNLETEHHPTIQAALKPLVAAERALSEAPALAG